MLERLSMLLHEAATENTISGGEWNYLYPELLLVAGIFVLPFIGRFLKDVRARQETALFVVGLSLLAVVWTVLPNVAFFGGLDALAPGGSRVILGVYEVTPFSLFFKFLFLGVAAIVLLVSPTSMKPARQNTEYYTLVLVATLGMLIVVSARDLLTLFVGLETAALASYPLAGYRKSELASTEASTKFVIIGALASALTLYGISLVYAATGTIDLYEIGSFASAGDLGTGSVLAIAFLVAGLGFKVTTVPFHMWGPDVYHGAPSTVSALLAAGSKKMGLAAMFKIFFIALFAAKFQWDLLLGVMAFLTMTVGNVMALRQDSVKRMLAWSSVAQAGYMLIAFPVGTQLALAGGLFHALVHALMKAGAFAIVAVVGARGVGDHFDDWRGLRRRSPALALTMALLLLSMAGLPPLAGFASKFVLFASAIDAGIVRDNPWLVALVVAAIVNSVVSLAYYVRLVRAMYVDDAATDAPKRMQFRSPVYIAVVMMIVGVIVMGVWPQPMIDFSLRAAASLLPA